MEALFPKMKQLINEGGNIKVGDHQAAPFKVTAENRTHRQEDIHNALHNLNRSFKGEHGHDLFHDGKAHYAGSSMHLMDNQIPHDEFAKHKGDVGDVDVHVPHEHGDKLHAHLKAGAKFGKYTVMGTKKHGADVSAIMKHENGENHQFDFVKGKHGRAEQSFLHSSNWNDVKRGVKGLHHKILLNAVGGDHHKFSISGGLKSRSDDEDKGHQHPHAISKTLFGDGANHHNIHSFTGVVQMVKDHKPKETHQAIYNKFKDSVERNPNDHTKALAHMRKTLGVKDMPKAEPEVKAKVKAKLKEQLYLRRGLSLNEEVEHHTSVIPLVGFSPISHMGHAHDLGAKMKQLPGKKHVGISNKADVFSPEERSHIMHKQWGQKDINHHFTKSGGDTIGHAYHSLPKEGKKHLHILVGGDRKDFAHGLKKSLEAGKIPEMNGHKWDSIHIHTPDDEERHHGMSGTNMRNAVHNDDHETFKKHLGPAFNDKEAHHIRGKIKSALDDGRIKVKRK